MNIFKIFPYRPYPLENIWAIATMLSTVVHQQFSMNIAASDLITIGFFHHSLLWLCILFYYLGNSWVMSLRSQVKLPYGQVNLNYYVVTESISKISPTYDKWISLISRWNQKRRFAWILQLQPEMLNHWQRAIFCEWKITYFNNIQW